MVSHFVARQSLFTEITARLFNNSSSQAIVLIGMGGTGKTQLALECCRYAEETLHFTALLWVDASSPVSVAQSYLAIARKVLIQTSNDMDSRAVISVVQDTLRDWKQRWLVVFDNYDDPKVFQSPRITDYIPKGKNGSILFTSRHPDSARLGHRVAISAMSDEESLQLLLQGSPVSEEGKKDGQKIVSVLGHLALAVDQAAAYIRRRHLHLKDFISHYNKRRDVILKEIPDEWEYRRKIGNSEQETVLSVFTTWEMAFALMDGSDVEKERKEHFLSLAACFDNKVISESYFRGYCVSESAEWMDIFRTRNGWDQDKLGDVLADCEKLSLLQLLDPQSNELRFSIHPIVRDWISLRKSREKQQQYVVEMISVLTSHLRSTDVIELSLQMNQETAQHIDACVQRDNNLFENSFDVGLDSLPESESYFARFYYHLGRYDEAEKLQERALIANEKKLGAEHSHTLRAMLDLATVYRHNNRLDKAEKLCERVLTRREKILGAEHSDTLSTIHHLACVYVLQGRWNDAEKLCEQVLIRGEKILGAEHPVTLRTMQHLADVYAARGRWNEAWELTEQAFIGMEKNMGAEHPDTINSMYSLAFMDRGQDPYFLDKAVKLHERVLIENENKLGAEHQKTLQSKLMLIVLYNKQGRFDKSSKLREEVMIRTRSVRENREAERADRDRE